MLLLFVTHARTINKIRFDRFLKESKIMGIIFVEGILKKVVLIFLAVVFSVSCGNSVTTKKYIFSDEEAETADNEKVDETNDDQGVPDETVDEIMDEVADEISDNDTQIVDEKQDEDEMEEFCGDKKVNGDEVCDGGSALCSSLGLGTGLALCKSDCSGWNTVNCKEEEEEPECTGTISKCVGTMIYSCEDKKWVVTEDCNDDGKICRAAKCITPGIDDPRVDFTGPDYDGDTILVFNTSPDGNTSSFSGTLTGGVVTSPKVKKINEIPFLRNDIRPPQPDLGKPAWLSDIRKVQVAPIAFVQGDTDTFYMYNFGTGNTESVTAELKYVGEEIEIWLVNGESFSSSDIQAIANEFDSEIFDLVTTNFYTQPDVDGNGKVSLILGDLGGFAAGYISPSDFYTTDEYQYSNFRDLIYIEVSMGVNEIYSTLTHEFQHLCHNNRNLLVENDWGSGDLYYRWIDEGLAMAAQQMYEGPQQDMIYVANSSDYNSSVRDGNSLLYWDYSDTNKVYSDYAMAYLFFQYLRIQCGGDTTIYNDIITCTDNDYTCVEDVIKDKVDSEYDLGQFMVDYRIALILEDNNGPYGFGGESGFAFTMPYFTGNSALLRGGGGLYLNSYSTFTEPGDAGNNVVFVGIDDK